MFCFSKKSHTSSAPVLHLWACYVWGTTGLCAGRQRWMRPVPAGKDLKKCSDVRGYCLCTLWWGKVPQQKSCPQRVLNGWMTAWSSDLILHSSPLSRSLTCSRALASSMILRHVKAAPPSATDASLFLDSSSLWNLKGWFLSIFQVSAQVFLFTDSILTIWY